MTKVYGEDAVLQALKDGRPLYYKEKDGTERPVKPLEVDHLLVEDPGGLSCEELPAPRQRPPEIELENLEDDLLRRQQDPDLYSADLARREPAIEALRRAARELVKYLVKERQL